MPAGAQTVYMVSNAHMDTQWNWDIHATIDEYIPNTLVQNFKLFEQYPDYIFNFEGAVKYAWMKEYYPEMFEKLKEYVAAGRWHISGASWDANDPNMPSVESFLRNILLGQEFYQKEFGVKSTDIMLPDCFGFGWQLPSIAAHCGLISFNTQKLNWRLKPFFENGRKVPFSVGLWQGPDGNRIVAMLDGGGYTFSPNDPVDDDADLLRRVKESPFGVTFRYFGTGDRGGSVSPTGIMNIDKAIHNPGPNYKLRYATSDQFALDYADDPRMPVYEGELLMDVHATGCYTSKVEMKNLNRRSEWNLIASEPISVLADRLGGVKYPAEQLNDSWKRIIWHQFHDDITGTSIPDAYKYSYNDEYLTLQQTDGIMQTALQSVASVMNTSAKGTPVLVYNPISTVNGSYAKVSIAVPAGTRSVDVFGPDGKKVRSQVLSMNDGVAEVAFAAADPSISVSVYDFRPSAKAQVASRSLKASGNVIENGIYRVTLDGNGDIASILDKRCGRELVAEGAAFGLQAINVDNKPVTYPAWEILKEVIDNAPAAVNGKVSTEVEYCGPLMAAIKVSRTYGKSSFVQHIILTDGAADDRIDVVNDVDWQSTKTLLKASFPVAFSAPMATYDIGMGHVSRGNNTDIKYEVYAQQWADMTSEDGSYGVTILNDSRYGWDKPSDNTLRLTLFYNPTSGSRFSYQETQDLGRHSFTYSIVGHKGALDAPKAAAAADMLNRSKIACATEAHKGALGKKMSIASTTSPALRVKALKRAQDGDGIIVRVYELSGKGASGKIVFGADIVSAEEVNGIGETIAPASFKGNALDVESGRFALKTFRVRLADSAVKAAERSFESIALPCNVVAYTTDEFVTQGKLTKEGHSFAGELMPKEFTYKNIPFRFEAPDYNDAVMCDGQSIAVPAGARKVYVLAASVSDKAVKAEFGVGGKTEVRDVDSFSGFYGVYGWPDFYESHLRSSDVAYIGTHRHKSGPRNESYTFTYMYLLEFDAADAAEITLPKGKNTAVFAMTAEM